MIKLPVPPETELQHYTFASLEKIFIHWNKLCTLQAS
jgi:hypothetical protein